MQPPTYSFDPVTLREVPDDLAAVHVWLAHLESLGTAGDTERVVWLRIVGELDAAEELGWEVLVRAGGPRALQAIAELPMESDAIGAALRLAHVLHWKEQFDEADLLFDAARATAAKNANNPDPAIRRRALTLMCFVDQHQGKSRYDQRRFSEALALFESALARRHDCSASPDQIASSELAVAAARAAMLARRATIDL